MPMREGVTSVDSWHDVHLVDATDLITPETGIVFGDVTCTYWTGDAVAKTPYAVTVAEWRERGEGDYGLLIGAGEFTAEGVYVVEVAATGCKTERFMVHVLPYSMAATVSNIYLMSQEFLALTGYAAITAGNTTSVQFSGGANVANLYKGRVVIMSPLSGTAAGGSSICTASAYTFPPARTTLTLDPPLAAAPTIGDYVLVLGSVGDLKTDVEAILADTGTDGVVVGSFVAAAKTAIAEAVWNAAYGTYKAAGTMGRLLLWAFLRLCGKRTITEAASPVETIYDTDDTSEFTVTFTESGSTRTATPSDQTP